MPEEHSIETRTHGRYLVAVAPSNPPIVGFHGYGENAEIQLDRLTVLPNSASRRSISIQALHRFYDRRNNRTVASWMTRQDRDQTIADNVHYVRRCLDAQSITGPITYAGFSQGVAMAFRAAVDSLHETTAVIAVGGDVPPDIEPADLHRIPAALLIRGLDDGWYTADKFTADQSRLTASGVRLEAAEVPGGHEWSAVVSHLVANFLAKLGV